MGKKLAGFLLTFFPLFAEEYGFSMDELEEIETKSYEYSGYVKGEHKHQILNKQSPLYRSGDSREALLGELFFSYKHFFEKQTIHLDAIYNYEKIDQTEERDSTINQLFLNYKIDSNHQLYLGKRATKWGKGYYINPAAFIDREKDPDNPEANREGFTALSYTYNKVYNSDIQNFSLDIVYLPTSNDLNRELYDEPSDTVALKAYFLYRDTDIDLIYSYNDKAVNRYGFDFSTNIESNFEIHGEYGGSEESYYSYLLGLKYLTETDLTVISEYYYQNEAQSRDTTLWDKKYLINSFTQKEPLDLLYFRTYFKNILNLNDGSYQNRAGFFYEGIKNMELDLSLSENRGKSTSDFGRKPVEKQSWLALKYSF